MSKQRASNKRGGTRDPEVAQLLRDLAVRERQLRDLTEQSLGFLEELAESRRLNGDRERLAERLGELERALTDAKRRLRHSGGAATTGATKHGSGKLREPLEVVFWGAGARADAVASCAERGKVPVSWVGVPDAVKAADATRDLTTIVNRDARTLAQCCNLGMAASSADAVLFVGPGVRLQVAPQLPADLPANAALLGVRIERGDSSEFGLDQVDVLMRLRSRPAPTEVGEGWSRLPWAAPDAFVVRRAAFDRIGAFDEGLIGPAALLDFTLRARRGNFDVLGAPGIVVRCNAPAETGSAELSLAERERLVVLAQHRPEQLGQALADVPILWQMESAEVPGFLAQLLARLPTSEGLGELRAVIERIAFGLVSHSLPAAQVSSMVKAARITLLRDFAAAGTVTSREEFLAAVRRAESQPLTNPAAAFDALAQDVALCHGAAAGTGRVLEQARAEMRQIDEHRHEQSARADRAEGAHNHAQQQLDQVQKWLREVQAELRQAHEARLQALLKVEEVHRAAGVVASELGQVKRDCQGLETRLQEALQARADTEQRLQAVQQGREDLERQLQHARNTNEQLTSQLAAGRAQALQTEQKLEAALQQHRELEREFLATDKGLRDLHEHVGEMARIVGDVADAGPVGLQQRIASVHAQAQQLATTLQAAGAKDAEQLLYTLDDLTRRLAASERTVQERETWIAVLLREVTQRRLMPRQLQEHEQALVDRLGGDRAGRKT